MNDMFQRILNDQNIKKIIQANNEREQNHRGIGKMESPSKKQYQSVLRRRKRETEMSIFGGGTSSSLDWAEDYYKHIFRVNKPREDAPFITK